MDRSMPGLPVHHQFLEFTLFYIKLKCLKLDYQNPPYLSPSPINFLP